MDAAVVGGGPAGSLAAILLGKSYDVALFEEHQSAGFPVQCAGLVSDKCYKKLKEHCKAEKAIENHIKGAFFFSPSGKIVLEGRGEAVVVERKILDRLLFERAAERAKVFVKEKARLNGFRIITPSREVSAEKIIGADGVNSTVREHFGFPTMGFFTAVQVEAKFEPLDENCVELYFGGNWSDSFFAYAIPLGDTARIGVVSRSSPLRYLENLMKRHPSVSGRVEGSAVELNAGAIPDRLVKFSKRDVALIGDAAGMVKPYTGGGLYYHLIAAEKLAESFPDLKGYEKSYLKEMGREYRFGYAVRKLYSLPDEKLEQLFSAMADFDFRGVHMDSPSTLIRKAADISFRLLRKPSLAFYLVKSLFL
ncbi:MULTISPECIES: NAD(P)/FAD-dependent oxidoreductase [Archaeoglobus]|uniref:Bacteriochlorophyll synthase, 43 kDa subunit (ChlP-2) n=3 Tax=Archaeoglobus fulgidus TaxID=2234 RepID=O29239_ARCFU|nr:MULTISPECIES: NAD(P)/FAD-dependent oxidoreductase [Archaeoglobus]AAB90220.1 bacteriochlorophyll synthase, 43 kDa subunit (chlP-2) [Archaeoglobus fulgidus DSM 4304]AIG97902.1 geranylgeranyl reductase family [Archaeoglobus fulgidus DSM 8774]KUJ92734.1 MAG: Bacteriochlorophyll synthase, 43 kDa subunit (ChlP-2) [Archaeoglobus fulgidus]KUK05816.1 MAG: Bacteriochlorophyll synthase, 43 kDa subunit (ChlP-2) [Archaeoglobus fulgidus]MDI3498445.1 hypothetical protein [Archaeoglobus sp.]